MADILQTMGIDVWRLRQTTAAGVTPYYRYELSDQNRVCALLFAEAQLANDEEAALVKAIAVATKKTVSGGLSTETAVVNATVTIILGEQLARTLSISTAANVFISYAPAQLLTDKSLKAAVWQQVKKAMAMMEG